MFRTDLEPHFEGTYHVTDDPGVFVNGHDGHRPCDNVRFLAFYGAGENGPRYFLIDGEAEFADPNPADACPDHFVGAETLRCDTCGYNAATLSYD